MSYSADYAKELERTVIQLREENARLRRELNEAQERSIEARNPGIDMDEVRRLRAGSSVVVP